MYPMTITIQNEAQLNAVVTAMNGIGLVKPATVLKEVKDPKPDVTAASSKPGAAPQTTAPAAGAQEQSSAVDYEKQVKPAALKLAAEKGRDALVAVCQAVAGVGSPKDAKPEHHAELLTKINEALAA